MEATLKEQQNRRARGSAPSRAKQTARIIKHLRQELSHEHPLLNMPTGWMIDCLLSNCPADHFNHADWRQAVISVVSYLTEQTSTANKSPDTLYQLDGLTPLFPNHEIFDDYDAHRFCSQLLAHLKHNRNFQD